MSQQNGAGTQKMDMYHQINKMLFSPKILFNMQTLGNLVQNKKDYQQYKQKIQSCEKDLKNANLTCLVLSGALALSLRRYMPNLYSTISFKMIAMDLAIVTMGLTAGRIYSSNVISSRLNQINTQLILRKDKKLKQCIHNFQKKYNITHRHTAQLFKNKKQLERIVQIIQEQPKYL